MIVAALEGVTETLHTVKLSVFETMKKRRRKKKRRSFSTLQGRPLPVDKQMHSASRGRCGCLKEHRE